MLSQFLRLGFSGYKRIIGSCQIVATHLAEKIEALEFFEIKSVQSCAVPCWCPQKTTSTL